MPEESLELEAPVEINGEPGSITLFSAAHLHASTANFSGETRYSIDFRTVHLDDVINGIGAPNIDAECSGTTMGDYLRTSDLSHLPKSWIKRYQEGFTR